MQLDLDFEPIENKFQKLGTLPFGSPFRIPGVKNKFYIRVKPVNWILNSNLVNDAINRNKCFVVALDTGTLGIKEGTLEVIPVNLSPIKYLGDAGGRQ
jgi:hypothetical protein